MKPKDFVIWVNGYNERLLDQHEIARRQSYFVLATQSSKSITMQQFFRDYWPLPGDKETELSENKKKLIELLKNSTRTNAALNSQKVIRGHKSRKVTRNEILNQG